MQPHSLTLAVLLGAALAAPVGAQTVKPAVPLKVEAFDLADVKLLDGPFKRAMERDRDYLLSLDPDRFLHNFRKNAGLEPKAPIYGGWESMGVAGQTLGHYLSACAMQYRATGDARFKQRVDYIVNELALCQEKNANGYVAAIPDGKAMFADVAAGNGAGVHRGWVPWYTMHKLFAGLRDATLYAGNAKAKDVLIKLSDWAIETTKNLSDAQWQKMLEQEHGGMNETLADVYALTGDRKYLDLARKFYHKAVLDPLAQQQDRLPGIHANTQVPKIIGMARLFELTGEARDHTIADYFWDEVVHHHSYAIGGNSDYEHFGPPDQLAKRLGVSSAETCNTYNMLKLTRHLFEWTGDAAYADYYERALYNHILASQDPDRGMVTYYVSLKPGHFKTFSTPTESFWCCVGTGMENHVKYGDSIYFHDAGSLIVNLFIPSEVTWRDKGLTLRQETRFPAEAATRLTLSAPKPVDATLKVRVPAWVTPGLTLKINGQAQNVEAKPGSYATLQRRWQNGDTVEIALPMSLHTEAVLGDPKKIAVLYGPIVLAGTLGTQGMAPPMPYAADQGAYFRVPTPPVPVLVTENRPVADWLKPVAGQPLTFQTKGVGRPTQVTLRPFYEVNHERYTIYWDSFTQAEWQQREAAFRAEQERRKALEALKINGVRIGEQQPEHDHNLQGQNTNSGDFDGHKWRDARDGWFSYDLKVAPNTPLNLIVTYWGDDAGGRTFDVLVDDRVVATEMLNRNRPGEFFDKTYPLPQELLQGKDKVTVRFQSKPGNIAGGIFGLVVTRQP